MQKEREDAKAIIDKAESERIAKNDDALIKANLRMVFWTRAAALAASFLFVMELVKYFHPPSGGGESVVKQIGIFF